MRVLDGRRSAVIGGISCTEPDDRWREAMDAVDRMAACMGNLDVVIIRQTIAEVPVIVLSFASGPVAARSRRPSWPSLPTRRRTPYHLPP